MNNVGGRMRTSIVHMTKNPELELEHSLQCKLLIGEWLNKVISDTAKDILEL